MPPDRQRPFAILRTNLPNLGLSCSSHPCPPARRQPLCLVSTAASYGPRHHPADLAAALQDLEPSVAWNILHQAAIPRQAAVFGYLDPDFRTLLVNSISQQDLAAIVMHMRADDRADLYRQLTEEQRETLMPALAQAEREDIRRLAAYREGTAGAIMTSAYAALPPGISASDALAVLRR